MTQPTPPVPAPVPLGDKLVWSLDDAARATGLSRRKLSALIATGVLPARRLGRRILLDPLAVKTALLGQPGPSSPAELPSLS